MLSITWWIKWIKWCTVEKKKRAWNWRMEKKWAKGNGVDGWWPWMTLMTWVIAWDRIWTAVSTMVYPKYESKLNMYVHVYILQRFLVVCETHFSPFNFTDDRTTASPCFSCPHPPPLNSFKQMINEHQVS